MGPRRSGGAGMTAPEPQALSKQRLKAWLRLLTVTRRAENHLREYLRVEHDTTLPRFDVMAALFRRREGMTMSELSRMLLVSNGNATAIVDRLEAAGLARRTASKTDRRTVFVALTPAGVRQFEKLAVGHEREVNGLFNALDGDELDQLVALLRRAGKGEKT